MNYGNILLYKIYLFNNNVVAFISIIKLGRCIKYEIFLILGHQFGWAMGLLSS